MIAVWQFCLILVYTPLIRLAGKENACFLILVRNTELTGIINSIKDLEKTFNEEYKYPYVFLNDEDFTEEFKKGILANISSSAKFGKLTKEQWGPPSWIDKDRMEKTLLDFKKRGIIYGDSLSYRNMCRFFSGFFYKHELVLEYDYYWRIEPNVNYYCKMNYDPFEFMNENNYKYGFVICIKEFMETIPSLWRTTVDFLEKNRNKFAGKDILTFILNDSKEYNGCHFWSNFEIASFDFFRSDLYESYFSHLDQSGGFYYERWGDAPVHSIAASLILDKKEIHHFSDIGYKHSVYAYCPNSPSRLIDCTCKSKDSLEVRSGFVSCLNNYNKEYL